MNEPPPPYPGQPESHSTGPCPNGCETGALTQGQLKDHMLDCPLQTVECELPGCDVKVLRRDLAKHMTENAQQHLLSATLLNLQLTRELHQKMEEKDRQITELQTKMDKLSTQVDKLSTRPDMNGFVCHFLELKDFKFYKERTVTGEWFSPSVSEGLGTVKVQIQINTNGVHAKYGYLSVLLHITDINLIQQIMVQQTSLLVSLHMLNRLGDYGHHVVMTSVRLTGHSPVAIDHKYSRLTDLGYDSSKQTQFLKDDSIHFRLYLKVNYPTI